ncbi:hypothetical protein J6590_087092 [Homalodisca vitripennis]|nr:hypothetical protein J6590_087092 [Homalodisca vitripennis]
MAEQAGCLQGQDRSAVTYPSSSHARHCLIQSSCDDHRTCCTIPLVIQGEIKLQMEMKLAQQDPRT